MSLKQFYKVFQAWGHADLVYSEPVFPEKYLSVFKDYVRYNTIQTNLDFGYVCEFPLHNVISFRGTDTEDGIDEKEYVKLFKRWRSNLDIRPLCKDGPWGKGTIHKGVYESFYKIKGKFNLIMESTPLNKKTYITGHSRGAWMAIMAARHMVKNLYWKSSKVEVVAFGCPNIFTKEGMKEYNDLRIDTLTVKNGWDIATSFPHSLKKPGKKVQLHQPWSHFFTHRIRDHQPKKYRKWLIDMYRFMQSKVGQ